MVSLKHDITEELSPWESWIINNSSDYIDSKYSSYDRLIDMAIERFDIKNRSRKIENIDNLQFLILYWLDKKKKKLTRKYTSQPKIAKGLGNRDHASIYHYIYHRKPSLKYELNTTEIKDFLES